MGESESPIHGATMKFVPIQAGSFMMGSPESEPKRSYSEQLHKVTLTHGFEMQVTEVTQSQWYKVMGYNPSLYTSYETCPYTFISADRDHPASMCPDNPVENVSLDDVYEFMRQLNINANDGYVYRLPTEAEWEYSARAGTNTTYYFGNDPAKLNEYAWSGINPREGGHTHEVGGLIPNGWGLYDMLGNVNEWVSDAYVYYYANLPEVDPQATIPETFDWYVFRGGSFYSGALPTNPVDYIRSASRGFCSEHDGYFYILGFRLVRTKK